MTDQSKDTLNRATLALRKAKNRISELESRIGEPIAIVGLACRFPGADAPEAFWSVLERGEDRIREIPAQRIISTWHEGVPRWAGTLDQVDGFDPGFFGISAREASRMDPQQRLTLEVAWEALEHAHIVPSTLVGSKAGVFIGVCSIDHHERIIRQPSENREIYDLTGDFPSIISGRVAYVLGLQGPAITLDTACSSSLVSIHLACASLRGRESDLALAGGTNLILSEEASAAASRMQALSPDGRCKTFDASANGFVRAEGSGMVVLERLSDAQRNGRRILAVIRASSINQDGRSTGLTAPNVLSQQALLRDALEAANLEPEQVSYIECHGTGTSLGDPIEVEALKAVYLAGSRKSKLWLGAVKTNIGHLEAAAGVAGVIKVALAMQHRVLPRNLHLRHLNPRLGIEHTPLTPLTSNIAWQPVTGTRIAGVSAFGISGTNAHVILEEPPPKQTSSEVRSESSVTLLPLSGQTVHAMQDQARRLVAHLQARPTEDLLDVGYSLATCRSAFTERAVVVASDRNSAFVGLDAIAQGTAVPNFVQGTANITGKLVFVFPGQGSQWPEMAQALLAQSAVFRQQIDACDAALAPYTDWSLRSVLRGEPAAASLERVDVVQPVLFAVMIALSALWQSLGIVPDAVIGHSQGEIAAACVAGILTLEDAARVVALRSRAITKLSGVGAMAAVALSAHELGERLTSYGDRLALAVDNGPASAVVSWEPAAIDELVAKLEADGIFARKVKVDYASHCPQIEAIRTDLLAALADVQPRSAIIPMYSTVDVGVGSPKLDADYWYRNLRQTVRFAEATSHLLQKNHRFFIEVSPHPVLPLALTGLLNAAGHNGAVIPTLRRQEGGLDRVLLSLGELHCRGHQVDWPTLFAQYNPQRVDLPTYAFQRQRFWLDAPAKPAIATSSRAQRAGAHPLVGESFNMSGPEGARYWERELSLERLPWLGDHKVEDAVLFPGAGFVEVLLAAALEGGHHNTVTLEQIHFDQPLLLATKAPVEIQVVATEIGTGESLIISQNLGGSWQVLSRAQAGRSRDRHAVDEGTLVQAQAHHKEIVDPDVAYESLIAIGLNHGPAFRSVTSVWESADGRSALALLEMPEVAKSTDTYFLHPILLDGCFQLAAMLALKTATGPSVPVFIERLDLLGPNHSGTAWCEVTSDAPSADGILSASFKIWNIEGELLCQIEGFRAKALSATAADETGANVLLDLSWRAVTELPKPMPGRWLVLEDRQGIATALTPALEAVGATVAVAKGVDPRSAPAVAHALHTALRGDVPLRGIVVLWNLDVPSVEMVPPADDVYEPVWMGVLNLLHTLQERALRDPPRLVFVTHRAQVLNQGDRVRPEQALLWGLVGTLRSEHAEYRPMRIDLGDSSNADEFRSLAAFAASDSDEDQLLVRGDSRHVARLVRTTMPAPVRYRKQRADDHAYRLEVTKPGTLDSLELVGFDRRAPERREVEISIEATGVNFRDVLLAASVIPPAVTSDHIQLGFECVGRVSRIGPEVAGLQIGQKVLAIALDCYATHVTTSVAMVVPAPETLSASELATLPVAHLTAYIGLHQIARLSAEERVLIHSAAGGVGLAALQWAKHVGAEIYATAGSDEKRAWLREQGVEYVSDSRSVSFVDDVQRWTRGEGVDVVLNALTGDLMHESLGLLRSGGRFVELGLRDAFANTRLGLAPFVHNLSYHLLNLADMVVQTPGRVRGALLEILGHVEHGVLKPLPVMSRRLSEGAQVLWEMGRGSHIGKYVLTNDETESPQISIPTNQRVVSPDRSYLIIGGLGGLGLALAHWMAEQGAGHLILVGRRPPERETQHEALAALERLGTRVTVMAASVAIRAELAGVIDSVPADLPLAGVVHAAAVLDDGMLLNLSNAQFSHVLAPKVMGAWNLHELTRGHKLDFFVLYSSAAAVLGNPGQGNYSAANTFLDALAYYRRSLGLPALSLAWGAFSDVGLAAAEDIRGARLSGRGVTALTPEQGVQLFAKLLRSATTFAIPCPFNARKWADYYLQAASWPTLAELLAEVPTTTNTGTANTFAAAVRAASGEEATHLVIEHVVGELAQVVRMDARKLDPETPFATLGVDSLMGVELRNRLEFSTGQSLPSTAIWTYPSPRALAAYLLERISGTPGPKTLSTQQEAVKSVDVSELRQQLEDISDDELLSLGEDLLS
jgi:acyl transferase domain-containing protein/acyl carrier protein